MYIALFFELEITQSAIKSIIIGFDLTMSIIVIYEGSRFRDNLIIDPRPGEHNLLMRWVTTHSGIFLMFEPVGPRKLFIKII